MDWVSIISAGIAGGIGGALGGLLGSMFQNKGIRTAAIVALAVIGGNLGKQFVQPYVETYLGASVRGSQFDLIYDAQLKADMKKVPALERIFRDDPAVEQRFKEKARAAFQAGGPKGLMEAATGIGAEVLGGAIGHYFPRARTEDLMLFARTMADVFERLNAKDPEACILHQFGTNYNRPLPTSRLLAAIGNDGQDKQLAALNAIVVNAGRDPVAFDKTKADAAIGELARRHGPLLTGASAEVASGKRPPADDTEAKIACGFAVAMFKDLASMDAAKAELVLRGMFGGT